MITVVPIGPEVGAKFVIVGWASAVNDVIKSTKSVNLAPLKYLGIEKIGLALSPGEG